jgi:hypothetical protein
MTSFHHIFSRALDSFFSAPCCRRQQARYQSTRPARFVRRRFAPSPRPIATQGTTRLLRLMLPTAPLVVEHLDVVEHLHLRLAETTKAIGELALHGREEAFHHRVVVAVAASTHAARDAARIQQSLVILARVRATRSARRSTRWMSLGATQRQPGTVTATAARESRGARRGRN